MRQFQALTRRANRPRRCRVAAATSTGTRPDYDQPGERIQHYPVQAVIRTGQQVAVPLSEVIGTCRP